MGWWFPWGRSNRGGPSSDPGWPAGWPPAPAPPDPIPPPDPPDDEGTEPGRVLAFQPCEDCCEDNTGCRIFEGVTEAMEDFESHFSGDTSACTIDEENGAIVINSPYSTIYRKKKISTSDAEHFRVDLEATLASDGDCVRVILNDGAVYLEYERITSTAYARRIVEGGYVRGSVTSTVATFGVAIMFYNGMFFIGTPDSVSGMWAKGPLTSRRIGLGTGRASSPVVVEYFGAYREHGSGDWCAQTATPTCVYYSSGWPLFSDIDFEMTNCTQEADGLVIGAGGSLVCKIVPYDDDGFSAQSQFAMLLPVSYPATAAVSLNGASIFRQYLEGVDSTCDDAEYYAGLASHQLTKALRTSVGTTKNYKIHLDGAVEGLLNDDYEYWLSCWHDVESYLVVDEDAGAASADGRVCDDPGGGASMGMHTPSGHSFGIYCASGSVKLKRRVSGAGNLYIAGAQIGEGVETPCGSLCSAWSPGWYHVRAARANARGPLTVRMTGLRMHSKSHYFGTAHTADHDTSCCNPLPGEWIHDPHYLAINNVFEQLPTTWTLPWHEWEGYDLRPYVNAPVLQCYGDGHIYLKKPIQLGSYSYGFGDPPTVGYEGVFAFAAAFPEAVGWFDGSDQWRCYRWFFQLAVQCWPLFAGGGLAYTYDQGGNKIYGNNGSPSWSWTFTYLSPGRIVKAELGRAWQDMEGMDGSDITLNLAGAPYNYCQPFWRDGYVCCGTACWANMRWCPVEYVERPGSVTAKLASPNP